MTQLDPSIDLSIAAPVLKDVSIKYHEQPFDGNFMEENDFRKNGSAKVDEAWESLGVDCMCLPLEQLAEALTNIVKIDLVSSHTRMELPAVSLMPMSKLVLSMAAVSLSTLRACITFTVWYELNCKIKGNNG